MPTFEISDEGDPQPIEADSIWEAAGKHAANCAGFDSDEPCWDPWTFHVADEPFVAELQTLYNGNGTISVWRESTDETKVYDQDGFEFEYEATTNPDTINVAICTTGDGRLIVNADNEDEAFKAVIGEEYTEEHAEEVEWDCCILTLKRGETLDLSNY